MRLIDTHTHLYCEEFDQDRHEAVLRAFEAGVVHMLLPAIDPESYDRQEELFQSYPGRFSQMMGLHPTSVNENYLDLYDIVEKKVEEHPEKYVAIGEIGLDLYWDTTFKDQQIDVLRRQIALADRHSLPVALHVRNAYDELFEVLRVINKPFYNGVLHCYSGTKEQILQAVEMGWHIGVGGTLTYKKSPLPEMMRLIPLERILLETDSPYLPPVPHRGKRNESAYVAHVAQFLAEVLELSAEHVAEQTSENAQKLFKISC